MNGDAEDEDDGLVLSHLPVPHSNPFLAYL